MSLFQPNRRDNNLEIFLFFSCLIFFFCLLMMAAINSLILYFISFRLNWWVCNTSPPLLTRRRFTRTATSLLSFVLHLKLASRTADLFPCLLRRIGKTQNKERGLRGEGENPLHLWAAALMRILPFPFSRRWKFMVGPSRLVSSCGSIIKVQGKEAAHKLFNPFLRNLSSLLMG